jgi:hypothetical protein
MRVLAVRDRIRNEDHFSPATRAQLNSSRAEEARRYGPMLDAMLLEARSLRLVEGHKARERTLSSSDMDHVPLNHSQEEA